jgi:hypothetical protein
MVQIYNEPSLGKIIGSGLAQSLNALAENKMRQVHQRNIAGGLQAANKNISEDQAMSLANLDPSTLNQVLKQMQEQDFVNALGGQGQTNSGRQSLPQQQMNQNGQSNSDIGKEPASSREDSLIQRALKQGYTIPTNRKAYNDLVKTMRDQDIEERKLNTEERKNAFKETKEIRHEARLNSDFANDKLEEYKRVRELETSGDLNSADYLNFLKTIGLDVDNLKTASTIELGKIAQNQIKDIGKYIKGSITNNELEQFMKTIPNLSQTPEGRNRVLANLERIARLQVEYYKAQKDIIKRNKGVPPEELEELTDDRMDEVRKKIGKQFSEDLKREVPASPSKLSTIDYELAGAVIKGAKDIGGTILSGAAKAAGPAIVGATVGSAIPGLGTLGGAGIGAISSLFNK